MNDNLFNNPYLSNLAALQGLSQRERETLLEQVLRNLELSGNYSTMQNDNMSGASYGGRIGYNIPMESGNLRMGVTGQGYKMDSPYGSSKDREITGGDVGYSWGPNDLSLSYSKYGSEMTTSPLFQLLFRRYFE